MKKMIFLTVLVMLAGAARADWDPELEAQEQAQREERQREIEAEQRETDRQMSEARAKADKAIMDSRRESLGAAAHGKSDAEVNRLFDAKIKSDTEAANKSAQQAREQLSTGHGAAAVKDVTGHSLQDIENMSDEELEALSRQMEKKYGD